MQLRYIIACFIITLPHNVEVRMTFTLGGSTIGENARFLSFLVDKHWAVVDSRIS